MSLLGALLAAWALAAQAAETAAAATAPTSSTAPAKLELALPPEPIAEIPTGVDWWKLDPFTTAAYGQMAAMDRSAMPAAAKASRWRDFGSLHAPFKALSEKRAAEWERYARRESARSARGNPDAVAEVFAKLRTGCDADGAADCGQLAAMHAAGIGTPRSGAEAARLYQRACDLGSGASCLLLGTMAGSGNDVGRDLPRSFALLGRACDLGEKSACQLLALSYMKGGAVPK
ncbi:sel1 repeat family protein, partial [bacterium]